MGKSEFKNLVEKTILLLEQTQEIPVDLFDKLAILILARGELKVGATTFRFTEIEFYLNNKSRYDLDPFTHEHDQKYETGHIRPHWAGIDISILEGNYWGGILIRGICESGKDTAQVNRFGPHLSLDLIFKQIVDIEVGANIKLIFSEKPHIQEICATPRINLKFKNNKQPTEIEEKFINVMKWRYHSYPEGSKHRRSKESKPVKTAL